MILEFGRHGKIYGVGLRAERGGVVRPQVQPMLRDG